MKLLISFILFFIGFLNVYGSDSNGFKSINFSDKNINFECETLCVIDLGNKGNNQKIDFGGILQGNGTYGVGVIVGSQLNPITNTNVLSNLEVSDSLSLYDKGVYSQIDDTMKIVFFFSGKIKSDNFLINGYDVGFFDKIVAGLTYNEGLTPYSINLRYGTKFFGVPMLKIFYIIAILGVIFLFVTGKLSRKNYLHFAIILFLLVGVKNIYDYGVLYFGGVNNHYLAEENKSFHNLGDYYEFTNDVRKEMGIDKKDNNLQCSYYAECYSDWPFCYHWRTILMQPCQSVKESGVSDYIILYKKEIPEEFKDKTILHSKNNSYLLKN